MREAKKLGPPKITVVHRYEPYADFDESIAKWVRENPEIDKWFWSKVAGVTHENEDGTSRQKILQRCEARELLRLVPEPHNPVDPNAIAVLRKADLEDVARMEVDQKMESDAKILDIKKR